MDGMEGDVEDEVDLLTRDGESPRLYAWNS